MYFLNAIIYNKRNIYRTSFERISESECVHSTSQPGTLSIKTTEKVEDPYSLLDQMLGDLSIRPANYYKHFLVFFCEEKKDIFQSKKHFNSESDPSVVVSTLLKGLIRWLFYCNIGIFFACTEMSYHDRYAPQDQNLSVIATNRKMKRFTERMLDLFHNK